MLLAAMPYCVFQLAASAGLPVITPARRQFCVFCSAGAIWPVARPPSPQSANPSFLLDAAASARVRPVLMKAAAARAPACATNLRRDLIVRVIIFRVVMLVCPRCAIGFSASAPRRHWRPGRKWWRAAQNCHCKDADAAAREHSLILRVGRGEGRAAWFADGV